MDVDGVLTSGQITYTSSGEELKSFDIKDGLGLKLLQRAGLKTAIITGRHSEMVRRRAAELDIDWVIQGQNNKLTALQSLAAEQGMQLDDIAYIGDDLPDLAAIQRVGIGMAVADAVESVRKSARFVTSRLGGRGAVREACEWLLMERGSLNAILASYEAGQ